MNNSTFQLLTRKEAASLLRMSERTLSRLCEDGRGPRRVQLSTRRVGFMADDLIQWANSRRAAPRESLVA